MKKVFEFIFIGAVLFALTCAIVLVYIAPIFFLIKMVVIPLLIAALAYMASKYDRR